MPCPHFEIPGSPLPSFPVGSPVVDDEIEVSILILFTLKFRLMLKMLLMWWTNLQFTHIPSPKPLAHQVKKQLLLLGMVLVIVKSFIVGIIDFFCKVKVSYTQSLL